MEKMFKRLLSLAVALFMVLGMVPASAFDVFAADDVGYMLTIYNEDGTENMTIDGTKSASEFNVASALEDAYTFGDNAFLFGITGNPTYELQLLQDVEMTEMFAIAAGKNVVIDLNGHAITSGYQTDATKHIYPFDVYGNLTIKDSVGGGSISGRGIYVRDGGVLTVESGTIYGIDQNGGSALYQYGGDIVINGGTIEQTAEGTYNYAINAGGGTVTINGGTVTGKHGALSVAGAAATVNGGELICTGNTGWTDNVIYVSAGSLTVNDGTVLHKGNEVGGDSGAAVVAADSTVTIDIKGGSFTGYNGSVSGNANTTISGGNFSTTLGYDGWDNLKNYVVPGATVTIEGETYTAEAAVVAQTMDAEGNVVATYTDFEEALAAACADESVVRLEIVADYETDTVADTGYYDVSKALTIGVPEGKTHTVTINPVGDSIAVRVNNGGSLTIEEGLTINHLDVTANGFATTGENTTIDGTLYAVSLKQWASNGTVTVSETGKVILGNGDGQLDLAYGNGTVTVNGNGDKTTDQFKAGYSGTRGNGNTLNLNNTSFEAGAWFNINGSNGTINVDNSVLKVSGGDSAGTMTIASSGNAINLTNGSLLKVATLTLGAGNTLALDATSSVEVTKLTGAGALVIDATGLKAGDTYSAISGDLSGFTGTIEVTGASLEAEIVDGKIVLKEEEPAYAIEVTYANGTVAYFNDILEAVPFKTNYDMVEGATIKLLGDYTGSGIRFCENDMVLDLNSFTYTINEGTGSNNTRTSAFQVRPEVTTKTTVKNGTIKIAPAAEMHQTYGSIAYMFNNYAPELVLENVVMDMENMTWSYGTSVYAIVSRAEDGVKLTGTTTVENFNAEIGGEAIYNGGAMEITATGDFGAIALTDDSATVTGAETLNVVSGVEGYVVSYSNGVHSLIVVPALPTATVTKIENENLTFALNFTADEVDPEQLEYYRNWPADYVLTVNKDTTFNADGTADGYLSGQYDNYDPDSWVNVPFEDVTLKAGESIKIMEYAKKLFPSMDTFTYGMVYEGVKSFNCGVFFNEEFLAANPDFEVTLELRMYNPANLEESYLIGETYAFTATTPELPTATATEIENEELTFAMNFKADEATAAQLTYYGPWYADYVLTVNKDVTFNADGGADGYLSGQYDAWSENWVDVPYGKGNVELKAGEELQIMKFAAELMGKTGLRYTYKEVYDRVKDFDCGVYFTDEFLAANPDLEVTLELRIYNPADETENYLIGETYVFYLRAPALPTATATEIENDELTFAMNFKADKATAAQLDYYGPWYADYVLTVNKDVSFNADGGADGYLSGQYDSWSENWVDVPYGKGNVTLKAGEELQIMKFAAELMGKTGLRYTYKEVYDRVKDFDCGVFFEDAFLAANPDLVVTLELRIYNNEDETENYKIGETYVFTLGENVAENVQTGKQYATVSAALAESQEGETVRLLKNVTGEKAEALILILNDRTLDLNGYILEATNVVAVTGGAKIQDSTDGTGLLKVAKSNLTLPSNDQLPVWIEAEGGFRFAVVQFKFQGTYQDDGSFKFQYYLTGALDSNLKEQLKHVETNGLKIVLRITYTSSDGSEAYLDLVIPAEKVVDYAGRNTGLFTTYIRGLQNLGAATITPCVTYGDIVLGNAENGTFYYTAPTN